MVPPGHPPQPPFLRSDFGSWPWPILGPTMRREVGNPVASVPPAGHPDRLRVRTLIKHFNVHVDDFSQEWGFSHLLIHILDDTAGLKQGT